MDGIDYFLVVVNLQPGCHSPVKMHVFNDIDLAERVAISLSKFCSRVYAVSAGDNSFERAYYLLRVYANYSLTFTEDK